MAAVTHVVVISSASIIFIAFAHSSGGDFTSAAAF